MQARMHKTIHAALAALLIAAVALPPATAAPRDGGGGARASAGGGGGGGGGGARAGGGGANRQTAQVNNTKADARSNNVRSTSSNSVNSNRNTNVNASRNTNVNVNVDNNNCCNNGWDNDYHPVATAVAVTATAAVIGSMVRTVPANCVPINYGGMVYQQCGSTWYQPQGSQFVVVNPPY